MNHNKFWLSIKVAIASAFLCGTAHAVTLSATAVDLADTVAGQDLWRLDYSLSGPLAEFHGVNLIYASTDFADLMLVTPPAAELATTLGQPDASAPFDGLLTLQAQSSLTSAYATHFSVSFTKLNGSTFSPQAFELVDDSFNVTGSGTLPVTISSPSPVPEPSEAVLLLLGTLAVAGVRRRRSVAA